MLSGSRRRCRSPEQANLAACGLLRPTDPCLCPGLVSLDLSDNRLTGVPPAVAAASNLTELSLQRNPRMAVDEAGIGLLLGLPRLRRLYLRGDCAPPHVLARLSQSAPQLQVSPDEAWELE